MYISDPRSIMTIFENGLHGALRRPSSSSAASSVFAHDRFVPSSFVTRALLICALLLLPALVAQVEAHGCMTYPNPRGSLTSRTAFIQYAVDARAPVDYFPHFPAGPRVPRPGAGIDSQRAAAGPRGWVPFEPLRKGFRWRSGVCGDSFRGPFEHIKGGRYYYNGKRVASFRQGSIISVQMAVNAHHNGFVEMHICDVGKCPHGEISQACFRRLQCTQLKRAWSKECQSGYSKRCAPIDRRYPGRWYLPCYAFRDGTDKIDRYGEGGTMTFELPDHLVCDHCVLQWFWTSANSCNPPGVIEYYDGPDRPRNWGRCKGQGGALGGVAREQRPCGGSKFPEEYLQCADIRVAPRTSPVKRRPPPPRPRPPKKKAVESKPLPPPRSPPRREKKPSGDRGEYDPSVWMRRGHRGVRDIILVENGRRVYSLNVQKYVRVRKGVLLSIEALTTSDVRAVEFSVDGKSLYVDRSPPFYILGSASRAFRPPLNRWTTITVKGGGDTDSVRIYFH